MRNLGIVAIILSLSACGFHPSGKLYPKDDPLLEAIQKAKCEYAALRFQNDYKWTIQLYTYPGGRRLGEADTASDKIFCIKRQDLYKDRLIVRMRSVADHERRGGILVDILPPIEKGSVWQLSVPAVSLDGWQILQLPYFIGERQ